MVRMLKVLGFLPALLAVLMLVGGHWALLQTVAWGGMMVKYSARAGLWVGLQETFDGEHPCPLCLALKKAQAKKAPADQLAVSALESRLLASAPESARLVHRPRLFVMGGSGDLLRHTRANEPPPTPLPRLPRA